MAKQLIIVESPAKVKTIKKFLGSDYTVQASVGHVRDLPSHTLGVDEENGFAPHYEIIDKKKSVVNNLRKAAAAADVVYLAPDPDREGEAIAWHVAELIRDKARDIKRIQFNEITERAVKEALAHPRNLNIHLFDAQQARRILDRLVGYKISPLLWKTIKRGISAGRVQSVALRLIVEREREREIFKPEEYWPFRACLSTGNPPDFRADLVKIKGKKAEIHTREEAEAFEKSIDNEKFVMDSVEGKERSRAPQPPFITSTLQQAANQRHSYSAKRTMQIAQRLYEGVELGARGLTALITYMRTDSTRIADEAREAAKNFILETFGKDHLPPKPRAYKAKDSAQDAHEAIRPVDVTVTPDSVKEFLEPDQYNIYRLIWTRFVASQMASARFYDTVALIACGDSIWRAKGERLLFDGFLAVMPKARNEGENELPKLEKGQVLDLLKLEKEQKFTQPPPRYNEASLVKELEALGIGRPSTYAAIISTLLDREYVRLEEKQLSPTDLGRVVCNQLVEHFAKLMDVGFTARMEEGLDKVAEGGENWVRLLDAFASDFNPTLEAAAKNMRSVKGGMAVELECPECGKPLMVKFGKAGPFVACSGYPECHFTSNFTRDTEGKIELKEKEPPTYEVVGKCPECGRDLVIKKSRTGSRFIACTGYPECHHAEPISTGVKCPECGKGNLVEKSSRKGKIFYSCDRYPECKFAMWNKPVALTCPRCGRAYLVEKKTSSGMRIMCPTTGCGYVKEENDGETGK